MKTPTRYLFLCLIFFSCSLFAEEDLEEKGKPKPTNTMHLIILADTTDRNIGKADKKDVSNIVEESRKIAAYTGMALKSFILQGPKTTYSNIRRIVRDLKVGSDDTIFFYFTGHGYRTEDKGDNPWPDLFLAEEQPVGIDFSFIVEELVKKKARLVLAIADSCNNVMEEMWMPTFGRAKARTMQNDQAKKENYKQLFLYAKGLIMASGSIPGEFSTSLPDGSLYTQAFLKALSEETARSDVVRWDIVMQKSQDKSNHWPRHFVYHIEEVAHVGVYYVEQHPQWIHLEDISNVGATLRQIGR